MLDLGKQAAGSHFKRLSEGLTDSELLKGQQGGSKQRSSQGTEEAKGTPALPSPHPITALTSEVPSSTPTGQS